MEKPEKRDNCMDLENKCRAVIVHDEKPPESENGRLGYFPIKPAGGKNFLNYGAGI